LAALEALVLGLNWRLDWPTSPITSHAGMTWTRRLPHRLHFIRLAKDGTARCPADRQRWWSRGGGSRDNRPRLTARHSAACWRGPSAALCISSGLACSCHNARSGHERFVPGWSEHGRAADIRHIGCCRQPCGDVSAGFRRKRDFRV